MKWQSANVFRSWNITGVTLQNESESVSVVVSYGGLYVGNFWDTVYTVQLLTSTVKIYK